MQEKEDTERGDNYDFTEMKEGREGGDTRCCKGSSPEHRAANFLWVVRYDVSQQ